MILKFLMNAFSAKYVAHTHTSVLLFPPDAISYQLPYKISYIELSTVWAQ